MIDVHQIYKKLGNESVLENLSFRVTPKSICGFLGKNGAGKTSTMRILCGLLAPDAGQVRIAGFCPFQQAKQVQQALGYLPEEPLFYRDLRVREQLEYIGALRSPVSDTLKGKGLRMRVELLLERCSLRSHSELLCSQLSKGYRQRLGLAQALLHDPAVLVLDEPSSGLDPSQSADFRQLIVDLSAEKTVLFSSHNLAEVKKLCDEVIFLQGGKIALHAKVSQLGSHSDLEELFVSNARILPFPIENARVPLGLQGVAER